MLAAQTQDLGSRAGRIAAALLCALLGSFACGGDGSGPLRAADMQVQLAAALREPETLARTAALLPLLQQLDAANVAGAAAAVDERVTVTEDADLRLFLHAWAAFDPKAALDYTQMWNVATKREFGAAQVIYYWAWRGDVGDARFHLDSLAEPGVRRRARSELVKGWARSGDYVGVTDYIAALPHGDLRDRYTALIVSAIIANEADEGVMRWADGVPEDAHDRFKRTAFRKALRHVSARDPAKAAAWYEAHADAFHADLGMSVVATEWVEREPEAAFAWLLTRPAGGQRDGAMSDAMRRWLAIDAVAADAWMRSGDRTGALVRTVEPFALWLSQNDPAGAVLWAERIPDEARRARTLWIIGRRWRAQDAEGYRAWLAEAELAEETREALQRSARAGASGAAKSAEPQEPGE